MISQNMLSQVLWNHAASANMANQGNWQLGHMEKIFAANSETGRRAGLGPISLIKRVGIQRKQLQRAFLEFMYHRTILSLGGRMDLLSCELPSGGKKPSLNDVVCPNLDKFIDLFHARWYKEHKKSKSDVLGHGTFEMYDGNWKMVRQTCAVDWCGVIDVGENRIRRSCRTTPAFKSAFCSSCLQKRATTEKPIDVLNNRRLDFVAELQRMKYLHKGKYFIESVNESRVKQGRIEVKVK